MKQQGNIPRSRRDPAAMLAVLALGGCAGSTPPPSEPEPVWFDEIAQSAGVEFTYDSGHVPGHPLFPEIIGGGAALFDMNNNGWLDLYLVQAGSLNDPPESRPPNKLYRNRGPAAPGAFEDITERSGADDRGYGMGVAVGDYNNSGFPDLYITNYGRNVLLRNNGDETFTDVTDLVGAGDPGWGASAAFFDMNADGWLDLFVVNYVRWRQEAEIACTSPDGRADYCAPNSYAAPEPDVLYRNEGGVRLTDVSVEAGLRRAFGNGLGVVCADFNRNGLIDVFVSNDAQPNQLWMNQGDGRFRDMAVITGCAVDQDGKAKAGMGVAVADLQDNGLKDLLVVNLTNETDSFYRNHGSYFMDETAAVGLWGVSRHYTRFGVAFADFDHDGLLDLYQANGRVQATTNAPGADPYAEVNLLHRGLPDGRFQEVSPRGGTAEPLIATSRAAAFGDLDNDGGLDVVIVNRDGPVHLKRNVVEERGNWISFRVLAATGNGGGERDAYNARLTLEFDGNAGPRTVTREIRSGYSYLAANDPRVHVGLGAAQHVRNVRVHWLGDEEESFGEYEANQIVTLRQGHSTP